MKKGLRFISLFISALSLGLTASSQTLNLNTPELIDIYRRAQLMGQLDSSVSFTVQPLYLEALKIKSSYDSDSSSSINYLLKPFGGHKIRKGKVDLQILPIIWNQQYNTHYPEGFNDGAMVPARGYQTLISAGFFAKYGPLSIQLMPELVFAENRKFNGFSPSQTDRAWAIYYQNYLNLVDLPERFGETVYFNGFWGQSSIRFTHRALSVGISSENLWWGPGKNNSLVIGNSAPGFKHITLNTVRPVKTFAGSFEGQLIAGRLESSGFVPPEIRREYQGKVLYSPKPDDWRYINAGILTYHPKWIPSLFLGITRSFYIYHNDLGSKLGDYLPFLTPLEKKNADITTGGEDKKKRDQLSSLFARWLFVQAKAEIYFEFGRNDHSFDLRDFLLMPEHSRAYVFGLRKILKIKNSKNFDVIQFSSEFTQLERNVTNNYRPSPSWYIHHQVRDGYTNNGQLLGAGIGPGSNMQSFDICFIKNFKLVGLQFERVVHNNDFHYLSVTELNDYWVDLNISSFAQWNLKNLLIKGTLKSINSFNYQHSNDLGNVSNLHLKLGVTYGFN
ncbi:MAG: hypothetical protein JWN56_2261 [Sphingobacteriales bacterium]|nr:hypothetical protein [Sphingobacteriales bacterium]